MKRIAISLILALFAAGAGGCSKDQDGQIVFVVPRATDGQFWHTVRAGASQAAKDKNAYLEWPSDFSPDDIKGQASVLRSARARAKVEGRKYAFAFAPVWGVGFTTLIRDWEQNDFRIDTFDEELPQVDGKRFVTHVGTLNEQAGRAGARALLQQVQQATLGRIANVAVLRLNPLSGSTTARETGFLSALSDDSAKTIAKVVSRDHYAVGVGVESSFRTSLAMLDELAEKHLPLDAVFCPNESTTTGMLRALENRGLAGKVIFVGFDGPPILATALWKGNIHALVLQDPYAMGYKAVRRALDVLKMDSSEYLRRVEQEDFSLTVTQHRVATLPNLQKCQEAARAKGLGELTGRKLADALLEGLRAKESQCLKDQGADCHPMFYGDITDRSQDLGEPSCNLNVLDLLYPPVEIWHLASPGGVVKK